MEIATYHRHTRMDAGIQSQGCVAYAILGFWIAAIPAAMTGIFSFLSQRQVKKLSQPTGEKQWQ